MKKKKPKNPTQLSQKQPGLIYANKGRLCGEGGKNLAKHRLPASWLHLSERGQALHLWCFRPGTREEFLAASCALLPCLPSESQLSSAPQIRFILARSSYVNAEQG